MRSSRETLVRVFDRLGRLNHARRDMVGQAAHEVVLSAGGQILTDLLMDIVRDIMRWQRSESLRKAKSANMLAQTDSTNLLVLMKVTPRAAFLGKSRVFGSLQPGIALVKLNKREAGLDIGVGAVVWLGPIKPNGCLAGVGAVDSADDFVLGAALFEVEHLTRLQVAADL